MFGKRPRPLCRPPRSLPSGGRAHSRTRSGLEGEGVDRGRGPGSNSSCHSRRGSPGTRRVAPCVTSEGDGRPLGRAHKKSIMFGGRRLRVASPGRAELAGPVEVEPMMTCRLTRRHEAASSSRSTTRSGPCRGHLLLESRRSLPGAGSRSSGSQLVGRLRGVQRRVEQPPPDRRQPPSGWLTRGERVGQASVKQVTAALLDA